MLSLEPITSPPKTYSNDIKGKGGEKLNATSVQGSIKEELKPNLD